LPHFAVLVVAAPFVAEVCSFPGVPGTGKTATVYEVVRSLREEWKEEEIPQVCHNPFPPHCFGAEFRVPPEIDVKRVIAIVPICGDQWNVTARSSIRILSSTRGGNRSVLFTTEGG
jgi:Cdc6-like AAA superfamily ATPase